MPPLHNLKGLGYGGGEEAMSEVYVIQVWAYHGVGTQGWRTVSQRFGEPYVFRTRAAAEAAMRKHFGNLRQGSSVRVQSMPVEPEEDSPA
jgi:hypothetical protein